MIGQSFVESVILLATAANATLLFAGAVLIRSLVKASCPNLRHSLLSLAFVLVLMLPVMSALSPLAPVAELIIAERTAQATPFNPLAVSTPSVQTTGLFSNRMISNPTLEMIQHGRALTPHAWVRKFQPLQSTIYIKQFVPILFASEWLWLFGALYFALRIAVRAIRVERKGRASQPTSDRVRDLAHICDRVMKMNKPTVVRIASECDPIAVPITWGLFQPVVLLPVHADQWSDVCLCAALMHEFAHVKRRDWGLQMLVQMTCAIHWFNPLAWLAANNLRADSESATDDAVIGFGMAPAHYAQSLVDVARSMPNLSPLSAIAMATPLDVNRRVYEILNSNRKRNKAERWRLLAASLTLCVLALPLAVVRVGAQSAVPKAPLQATKPTPKVIIVKYSTNSDGVKKTETIRTENTPVTGRPGEYKETKIIESEDFTAADKLGQPYQLRVLKILPPGVSLSASDKKELSDLQQTLRSVDSSADLTPEDIKALKTAQEQIDKSMPDIATTQLVNARYAKENLAFMQDVKKWNLEVLKQMMQSKKEHLRINDQICPEGNLIVKVEN